MSKQSPPPPPPEARSDKGPGSDPKRNETADLASKPNPPSNVDKQGHQGGTKVGTTHKGYQQDR